MKKLKIYLDTSVIGGCFDDEFAQDSRNLLDEIRINQKYGVISEVTLRELTEAPLYVKDYFFPFRKYL